MWIEYKCNSGQTVFLYNKETGEHKWPPGYGSPEGSIIEGKPIKPKGFCSVSTQTDDSGCSNGCTSIYINTDITETSNITEYVSVSADQHVHIDTSQLQYVEIPLEGDEQTQCVVHLNQGTQEEDHQMQDIEHDAVNASETKVNLELLDDYNMDDSSKITIIQQESQSSSGVNLILNASWPRDDLQTKPDQCDASSIQPKPATMKRQSHEREQMSHQQIMALNDNKATINHLASSSHCSNEKNRKGFVFPSNNESVASDENSSSMVGRGNMHASESHDDPQCSGYSLNTNESQGNPDHDDDTDTSQSTQSNSECSYCGKQYKTISLLKIHLRTHTKEKPFKCSFCSKTFSAKSNLKVHLKIHTGDRDFKCSICDKSFITKRQLQCHQFHHGGEKPFKCSQCSKSFATKAYLDVHNRTHTKEKPFECSYCGKKFSVKCNLKVHINTHMR